MEQYGFPVIGVALVAPSIRFSSGCLHWEGTMVYSRIRPEVSAFTNFAVGNTTRNGEGANDKGHIDPIRNGDALDTTGCSDPFIR